MFAGLKRPAGLYIIGSGENKNRIDRGNGKVTPFASFGNNHTKRTQQEKEKLAAT